MRLSTRLVNNAATTYLRMGATFVLGLFTTWYTLGAVGVLGFGLMALAGSSSGLSQALERSLRLGLVRELAAAIASGDPTRVRCSLVSSFRLCVQAAGPVALFVLLVAAAAWAGVFSTPAGQPELSVALAVLILGEGVHVLVRLLSAPYLQSLFAAQRVGLDNILIVVARTTHAVSAVVVFGLLLPDATLPVQLYGFAVSRMTLQLTDVALGIWLAKRCLPGLRLDPGAYDDSEYRSVRSTVWHSSQVALYQNANSLFLAVLINLFFGLTYNGIWRIVVQFSGYVRTPAEGLLRGVGALTTHLLASGRRQAVVGLLARSIRYQYAVTLPAAAFLGVFVRPLLDLWVGGRLDTDPYLAQAGIGAPQALDIAVWMALILLVVQVLRGSYFGVERVLYGMGQVRSYAWASKWAVLICVGTAAALMGWSDSPIMASVAVLISQLFYTGAVLLAARRETRLSILGTLRRALPGPVLASLGLLLFLVPLRTFVDRLTPLSFGLLLAGSILVYVPLALMMVLEPGERLRLIQLVRNGVRREGRRIGVLPGDPP